MPRTVRLGVVDEPPPGTRYIIDLSSEAYLEGVWKVSTAPGLLEQMCGQCAKVIVRGSPSFSRDSNGTPILLRCAHCRAFNEMLSE